MDNAIPTYGRLADIDAIRGVAIGQVLLWHLWVPAFVKHAPLLGRLLNFTWTGVDLFFVLSGYLIGSILLANRKAENFYVVFYGRRVLRIIPLYARIDRVLFSFVPAANGASLSHVHSELLVGCG